MRALTRGRGADFSFEVVGRPELIVQAFNMARAGRHGPLVGMPSRTTHHAAGARAVFSGKRLAGSVVGGAQILRTSPGSSASPNQDGSISARWCRSASGLDEINDGLDTLPRAEGVRTVIQL